MRLFKPYGTILEDFHEHDVFVEEDFPEEWLGLSPQELILTMWERIKELERALDVLVD